MKNDKQNLNMKNNRKSGVSVNKTMKSKNKNFSVNKLKNK